jgi:phosphohistidine phosphatase SixA
MRSITLLLLSIFLLGFAIDASAQKKTIILVRHAEKDVSVAADQNDPALSPAGVERAERLAKTIKKYRPGAVYSTNYKRTQSTAEPIAKLRKVEIQTYDPRDQAQLVDQIMKSRTKRFVVAGHSNTIPLLANLFIKKEIFKPLDESEYGAIWIIRMKNGKPPKVEVLSY